MCLRDRGSNFTVVFRFSSLWQHSCFVVVYGRACGGGFLSRQTLWILCEIDHKSEVFSCDATITNDTINNRHFFFGGCTVVPPHAGGDAYALRGCNNMLSAVSWKAFLRNT